LASSIGFIAYIIGTDDKATREAEAAKISRMSPEEHAAYVAQKEDVARRQGESAELFMLNRFAHHRDLDAPMTESEKSEWRLRFNLCEAAKRTYDDEKAENICEGLRQ
jgi:hypothetical protein